MKKFPVLILISAMLLASFSCSKPEKEDPVKPDPVKPDPTPTPDPDPQPPTIDFTKASLGELAAKKGVKLGAAVTYWEYRNNPQVKDILKREFDAVTFGNEMKHDAIVNASGKLNFSSADEMVSWMKECGVDLFGHTLGWHQQQQIPYMNSLIAKASDNSESLLKSNLNLE
ncbi:MAG: endo-1,4-beta-xylanase [Bacteroidales bacterium]|nr:endo-1,4-beta-xylanase [Bacteroidales bacterium]